MKYFHIFIIIVIFINTNALHAKDKWLELKSEHFILRTDADLEKARKTIEDLEKFRFTLGALTGLDLSVENRPPLTIYAFRYTRKFNKQLKTTRSMLGFYRQRHDRAVAVLSLQDGKKVWQFKGTQILFHEYSHHILHFYSPFRYPVWFDEGFGEYLSTISFKEKTVKIGEPAVPRFINLRDPKYWVKIEDIIRARSAYPKRGRSRKRGKVDAIYGLYAQGWLLTHYIYNKPEYREPLNQYMLALNEPNADDDIAFQSAFGKSFKEMENELLAYWKKGSLAYLGYDFSNSMPDFDITIREMSQTEADIQHDEARHLTGNRAKKFKKARKSFEKALEAGIRPDDMRIYLAELALHDNNPDQAKVYATDILKNNPVHAPALQIQSRAFTHGKDPLKLQGSELTEYRSLVTKALKADKYYVPALLDYARLYFYDGIEVTPNVLEIAELARKLAPDNFNAKTIHISLLWKNGDLEKARREAQLLIDWAASDDAKKQYQEYYQPLFNADTIEQGPENG